MLEDKKIKLVVELPFDNQWDFTFDISYDVTGTFGLDTKRGNRIPTISLFQSRTQGLQWMV